MGSGLHVGLAMVHVRYEDQRLRTSYRAESAILVNLPDIFPVLLKVSGLLFLLLTLGCGEEPF